MAAAATAKALQQARSLSVLTELNRTMRTSFDRRTDLTR
jgi:hypothetical protein